MDKCLKGVMIEWPSFTAYWANRLCSFVLEHRGTWEHIPDDLMEAMHILQDPLADDSELGSGHGTSNSSSVIPSDGSSLTVSPDVASSVIASRSASDGLHPEFSSSPDENRAELIEESLPLFEAQVMGTSDRGNALFLITEGSGATDFLL